MTDAPLGRPKPAVRRVESAYDVVEIGQWYWVDGKDGEWLGCVTHVGSNYVEIDEPQSGGWRSSVRVLLEEMDDECRLETDAKSVIADRIAHYQQEVQQKIAEVQTITARLGVGNQLVLADKAEDRRTYALASLSGQDDIGKYKADLIRAEKKELPALFQEIEAANRQLARWMGAETLSFQARADRLKSVVGKVNDRIFNVELYAGLTEEVEQITDGDPAGTDAKLHVMQRRCYMDEECLVDYRVGGMDFQGIGDFDEWLAEPAHRDRILPFDRCMVAFRVRRYRKDRDHSDLRSLLIKMRIEQADESTFLYIRNGDQLFRMSAELEFGRTLFPDPNEFHPGEAMWARMWGGTVKELIPDRQYQDMLRRHKESNERYEAWEKANPGKSSFDCPPSERGQYTHDDYEPFDESSVYYDEMMENVTDRAQQYNRVALIIQGLFDRSPVLHPHAPVKMWTSEGFGAAVKLIYDGGMTLHDGPPPDFEAYCARVNEGLKADCVTFGQQDFWLRAEAVKENDRRQRDWRHRGDYIPTHFSPYGNDGPGRVARIAKWMPQARKARFVWTRERVTPDYRRRWDAADGPIRVTITVPADKLFNVDGYTPGDFRQFFNDPRTRAKYLKWADMLLTAEEYHAGNVEVQESSDEQTR